MRTPSRRMPPLEPQRGFATAGRILLAMLAAGLVWVMWRAAEASPWLTAIIVCAAVLSTKFATHRRRRRMRAWARARPGESICTFARSFDTRAVDTWVIRAVYEQLQAYLAPDHAGFPVRASDVLVKGLLDHADDLDLDLVFEIAQRTGRSLEQTDGNPMYGKVTTVRDLVMFFVAQPQGRAA